MRKGLTFIVAAVLAFVLGDAVFGFLVDGVLRRSEFRFARLYTGRLQGDVMVFGNSRAVNGFCVSKLSELTGAKWVNLGYNGLGPSLVEAFILDYLDRYPAPRTIVLEVSNLTQGADSIRDCRLFVDKSRRLAALDRRENGYFAFLAAHIRTLSVNGELLMRCIYYLRKSDQAWVNNGRLDAKQADRLRLQAGKALDGAVRMEGVRTYRKLIRELRARGISVWCVVTPYFLTVEDQRHAQEWLNLVKEPDVEGVRYYNFVNRISDPNLFADPSHLNCAGSIQFANTFLNL